MAKRATKTDSKALKPVVQNYNLTVQQIDRSRKELQDWRRAITSAESLAAPNRKYLYDLYNNLILDTHLSSVMDKRVLPITNLDWVMIDKEGNQIEDICKLLDSTFFDSILTYIIESRLFGFSLQQIDFTNHTTELIPRAHVNPKNKLVLGNPFAFSSGIAYNEAPFMYQVLEAGKPDDLGLLLKVAPYVIMKRGDVGDWATFCEIFGMPLRVVKYDPTLPSNRIEAENAMKDIGSAGYIVLPDGSEIEFPSTGAQQGNDVYDRFADFCNKEISKCIVGNTMTTEDGSSRSQSETHQKQQDSLTLNDLKLVKRLLNERLIPLMLAQGLQIPEGAKIQPITEEHIDSETQLKMDLDIHEKVGSLPKEYFKKKYKVEFVDESDTPPAAAQEPTPEPPAQTKKQAPRVPKAINNSDNFWKSFFDFFGQAPS